LSFDETAACSSAFMARIFPGQINCSENLSMPGEEMNFKRFLVLLLSLLLSPQLLMAQTSERTT
jgi:hypothetical protein